MIPFIVALVLFVVIAGGMALLIARSGSSAPIEDPRIRKRAAETISKYGGMSFKALSREQRLTLLQSYYCVKNYGAVTRIGEFVLEDLRNFSKDRQLLFVSMVREAYIQLGQKDRAKEYLAHF